MCGVGKPANAGAIGVAMKAVASANPKRAIFRLFIFPTFRLKFPDEIEPIGLPEAQAIALKVQPGTIVDTELEKESGGSGLRYSFDVKSGTTTYEVGVDAETGKLLENIPEGKNPD